MALAVRQTASLLQSIDHRRGEGELFLTFASLAALILAAVKQKKKGSGHHSLTVLPTRQLKAEMQPSI